MVVSIYLKCSIYGKGNFEVIFFLFAFPHPNYYSVCNINVDFSQPCRVLLGMLCRRYGVRHHTHYELQYEGTTQKQNGGMMKFKMLSSFPSPLPPTLPTFFQALHWIWVNHCTIRVWWSRNTSYWYTTHPSLPPPPLPPFTIPGPPPPPLPPPGRRRGWPGQRAWSHAAVESPLPIQRQVGA